MDDGALLLSPFTGASRELTGAYRINPDDPEETADIIFQALEDSPEEQSAGITAMRAGSGNTTSFNGRLIFSRH